MASTRVLVKRRKAIRNIRKITRTMELIATARFKKAMDRAVEADAFTRKIAEIAADLAASATEIKHPLLEKRTEVKNSVLLVLCSNRGLCGGYNGSILREGSVSLKRLQGGSYFLVEDDEAFGNPDTLDAAKALAFQKIRQDGIIDIHKGNVGCVGTIDWVAKSTPVYNARQPEAADSKVRLELSGKRAIAYYKYQGIAAEHSYTHFEDKPSFEEVDVLATRYLAEYGAGKIDRLDIAYMKFLNAARQMPVVETLLPLSSLAPEPGRPVPPSPSGRGAGGEGKKTPVDYEFLPSAAEILEEILPVSFKIRLFKCFLDSAVSEQIARRVAMKAATENAGEMIKDLSLKYNRARQAQITKEISEIIGGAAALK